jgi:hypothetical protein
MPTGICPTVDAANRHRLEPAINSPQKHVWRCRIVLGTADGLGTNAIMRMASVAKTAVWRWQEHSMAEGVEGLLRNKARPSCIPPPRPDVAEGGVHQTLADPPSETTHWTADAMAKAGGISASAVRRIWKARGLDRYCQSKLSNDPRFAEKLRGVVGQYAHLRHMRSSSRCERLPSATARHRAESF